MIVNLFQNRCVLFAVAHNDDVEFMFGGTLSKLAELSSQDNTKLIYVTFAIREKNTGEQFEETLKQQGNAIESMGIKPVHIENFQFRARFLPDYEDEIRLKLKDLKTQFDPDIILTHYQRDPNQDHITVYNQVRRVFPDKSIIGGEISNTGDRLMPNLFIGLDQKHIQKKYNAVQCYTAENHKFYFQYQILESLARTRGAHSGNNEFAEAFEVYRLQY